MRIRERVTPLALLLAGTFVQAQSIPTPVPGAVPGPDQQYQRMQTEMQSAQATAYRPGDDALDCDAIVAEIQSTIEDPAYQAYIAESGAAAQRDLALMQNPYAAAPQSPAQAQLAAQQRVAAQQAQSERLITLMPLIMRMQRLAELAVIKACDWAPPGMSDDATDP